MFYLFNLLLVPLYYFIIRGGCSDRRKAESIFFKVACLHAILFRALADPFNYVDTANYAQAYEEIGNMTFLECITCPYISWGVGYVVFNWLLSKVSVETIFLFTVLTVVTVGGVMKFYSKTSYAYLLTVMFYLMYPMLYYMSFGVVRQHFSIIFFLAALYNIDKYKVSVPLALTAVLMHTSSIILLPFFFWRKLKFDRKSIVFYLICTIMFVVAFRSAMSAVLAFFPRNADFMEEGSSNIVPVVVYGMMVLGIYFSGASKRFKTDTEKNIFSFLLYGLVIALCSLDLAGGGRLSLAFMYVIPVVLTYLKRYAKHKGLWYGGYCVALFGLILLQLYLSYEPGSYDYLSIFDK